MSLKHPPNAKDVRSVVEARLLALETIKGVQETVRVEWRDHQIHIPVISMPLALLYYNPDTHRIRAQRSSDPVREQSLDADPFGESAQNYLHFLLMGDPTDPSKTDQSFVALKEDLQEHGQSEPGIMSRWGVLINGNTRRAALKELGQENLRVGVLPIDAGYDDLQSIELSLQLRKDHKREYSFMNSLLAIDERVAAGHLAAKIQSDFRIKANTYEQRRWILAFVRDAIERSKIRGANDSLFSMQLIDFESHQGKLEELYRTYMGLKVKSPDQAEKLREQRLLALAMDKSKTDLRFIEPDFVERYMKASLPPTSPVVQSPLNIPGTSIKVAGPSQEVQVLRELTTRVLREKSITLAGDKATTAEITKANDFLGGIKDTLNTALDRAGKQERVVKKRLAPVDRISDACDDLDLAVGSIADARATGNFDPTDLEEVLSTLKTQMERLSAIISRGPNSDTDGLAWIKAVGKLVSKNG